MSELKMELQAALVDLGHKSAFDLLLKEAWNSEQAAMGNSTLPTVCDKLNQEIRKTHQVVDERVI